jgi:DNA replication and repair protein RecF
LDAWNEVLAEAGGQLITRRCHYVAELRDAFREILSATGIALPKLELVYRPSPVVAEESSPEELLEAFSRKASDERQAGRPLVGPHLDELLLLWGDHETRRIASAGEKKLLGLLLTAARGLVLKRRGREPVYLLDDIDAELDLDRLRSVIGVFSELRQVFFSSSNPHLATEVPGARRWSLSDGLISSAHHLDNQT